MEAAAAGPGRPPSAHGPRHKAGFFVPAVEPVTLQPFSRSRLSTVCTILALMMRKLLVPVALVLATAPASAVICKSVDADGVVSYADVPASECPEVVKLPDYSRYSPRPITPLNTSGDSSPASAEAAQGTAGAYSEITIVEPPNNGTVRSNEGLVQVVVGLQPPLQAGHRIKLFLDGGAIAGEFDAPAIQLSGVERGTHTLRAVVSDASGRRIADTPSVRFTLRKTTLLDQQRVDPPPEPGEPSNPIEPTPENPIAPAPETPDRPTNLQPNPGQFGNPGSTNPAFAPRFTP
jgi:hypothetical protein